MKLKTSIIIISGCLGIFLFIMLPIFLSIQNDKEKYVASFKGSKFNLRDMNNEIITDESFKGPLTAIFLPNMTTSIKNLIFNIIVPGVNSEIV